MTLTTPAEFEGSDRGPSGHPEEIRRRFEGELENLRNETIRLGALVLENTKRLGDAILENRLDLAREVIDNDAEIDTLYSQLERNAFLVIATQQPVAGDLRLLISVTRILYELERSGDLAVNCAKGLLRRHGYELPPNVRSVLARLLEATTDLFGKGLDVIRDMDPEAGAHLHVEDDVVDQLTSDFYSFIVGERGHVENVDLAVELSRMGRYLERIADHAVNVGEHICFIVTGSFPRHSVEAVDTTEA